MLLLSGNIKFSSYGQVHNKYRLGLGFKELDQGVALLSKANTTHNFFTLYTLLVLGYDLLWPSMTIHDLPCPSWPYMTRTFNYLESHNNTQAPHKCVKTFGWFKPNTKILKCIAKIEHDVIFHHQVDPPFPYDGNFFIFFWALDHFLKFSPWIAQFDVNIAFLGQ